jgi:outer membrane lipoprotein-sorting protein
MKKFICSVLTVCAATVLQSAAAEMTGREIMEKQEDLQHVDTEYGEEIMLLQDIGSGTNEKRNARRYGKDNEEGLGRSLFAFLSPADIAGTAVLTWEQTTEDDQWLYMPATKKMQRIASGSKKNYFMGTDFTYEDMEPEDIDNFNYTVLRTETLNVDDQDCPCWVIESVPANTEKKRESGYSKRLMWIDQKRFVTLKVEFFDRRRRLIKTQIVSEVEHIEGTVWRAKKTLMDNVSKEHKTLSLVTARKVNEPIEDDVFTERFILNGKHIQ